MRRFATFETPLGMATAVVDSDGALVELSINRQAEIGDALEDAGAVGHVQAQLGAYFRRERTSFDLQLAPAGSDFQHQVWRLLLAIPFGETRTYGQLAAELGDPQLARAVGRANATNPVWLVIPCHRVIGATGDLTGYAGGLDIKRALLEFEGALSPTLF